MNKTTKEALMSNETRTYHIDGNDYSFDFLAFDRFFDSYKRHCCKTISEAETNLATSISLSSETIHSWRFKKNAPADIDTIKQLAKFFGANDYLLLLNKKIGEKSMTANDRILDSLKRIYDAIIVYLDDYDSSSAYLDQFYEFKEKKYSDEEARLEIYGIADAKLHKVEVVLLQEYIILHKLDIYSTLENYVYRELCDLWDNKLDYESPKGIQIYETNQGAYCHEDYEVAFNKINEIMSEYF